MKNYIKKKTLNDCNWHQNNIIIYIKHKIFNNVYLKYKRQQQQIYYTSQQHMFRTTINNNKNVFCSFFSFLKMHNFI